jgi:hypothetical protein
LLDMPAGVVSAPGRSKSAPPMTTSLSLPHPTDEAMRAVAETTDWGTVRDRD